MVSRLLFDNFVINKISVYILNSYIFKKKNSHSSVLFWTCESSKDEIYEIGKKNLKGNNRN